MTPAARRSRYQRSTGCSLTKPWPPSSCTPSEPICIPFCGAEPAGDRRLAAEVLALVGAAGGPVGGEPHAVALDPDVGDREGDALAVGDRFAERLAVVDVGDDVVEHRLRGADRERAPGDPRPLDALDVVLAPALAEQRRPGTRAPSISRRPVAAGRRPIAGSSSIARPSVPDSTTKSAGPMPSASAATRNSSHSRGPGEQRLGAVEHPVAAVAARLRLQLQRVEERPRLEDRQRRRRHVLAGEGGQVGRLLLGRAPEADRGGDRAGGERRVGDPHVAVGERLADQRRWSPPPAPASRRRAPRGRRAC